jgi:thymidylate kinase
MGAKNYMIDGCSGTGKTAVCNELQRRSYQAIHGDRELKINPKIDKATNGPIPGYDLPPLWDVEKVNTLIANDDEAITFFCGGCSNSSEFIDRLDGVFVLEVDDINTVMRRIDERVLVDPTDWGGKQEERDIIIRAHQEKKAVQTGWAIDATAPLENVVDEILRRIDSQSK